MPGPTPRLHIILLVAILALSACDRLHSPTEPEQTSLLGEGHFGSSQMCLDVTASSAKIATLCGSGSFPRPAVNTQGMFSVDGTYDVIFGPPPPSMPPPTPVHFTGSVDGDMLVLTITSSTKTYGPFKATRNSLVACPASCP